MKSFIDQDYRKWKSVVFVGFCIAEQDKIICVLDVVVYAFLDFCFYVFFLCVSSVLFMLGLCAKTEN